MGDGVLTIDEQGIVQSMNPAGERLFGYAAAAVIGQNIKMLMPEPYRGEHDGYLARYRPSGEAHVIGVGREVQGQRKDGTVFPLELTVSEMQWGHERHFAGVVRDITERRSGERAARYLHDAVQAIPEGFAIFDPDDRLVLCNHKYLELYQLDDFDRVEGRSFEEILRVGLARGHYQAALGREEEWLAERLFLHQNPGAPIEQSLPDGRWLRITECRLSDGSIAGLRADITDLKRAQDAREAAREAAELANRAKSEFLAMMSHEIRTPMNGVIGMVEVLHQTSLKGYQVEMVDIIRDSAFSLLGIIEDILDFSKIEAGKLELEAVPTSIADVVEKGCGMLDHLAARKEVELTLFTDPALPAQVLGDAQRLRQVVINLANNAIKFCSGLDRQGRVSVRAVLVAREEQRVVIEIRVADNGIGMDEATCQRLFTPFTQADASTTRRFGGTGLGLAISRDLVQMMGGEITVQSTPGAGSTFTVCLSLALAPGSGDEAAQGLPLAGLFCLAVGAEEGLSNDLSAYLVAEGASVLRVPDLAAARAFTAAGASGPSVWLIDGEGEPPSMPEGLAAAEGQGLHDVRWVVIGRGGRRRPRALGVDGRVTVVDANMLTRQSVVKAVAIAAGRRQQEQAASPKGKNAAALLPPTRAQALQQGRLILVAPDGLDALRRWRSGDYALILTDLHMPQMDGYHLAQAIRKLEGSSDRIPIVALTANALMGEAQRCLDVGMDDYLTKPTPLAELKAMLDQRLPPLTDAQAGAATHGTAALVGALPVDVRVLAALVGDDAPTLRRFLLDFSASAAGIAAELAIACGAGQAVQAGALAHKLKSSARSVGALALGELCAEMEVAGKAGNGAILPDWAKRFEAEMAAVELTLQELTAPGFTGLTRKDEP